MNVVEAVTWPYRVARKGIKRAIGVTDRMWIREVMNQETDRMVHSLDYAEMDAIELSGNQWSGFGFRSYQTWDYPKFDICADGPPEACCDILIAEQVFEHVLWPYRAVRNAFKLLRPGGVFLITTPFMIRIHNHPVDCSRWSELGIKYFLAEGGFPLSSVQTGAWGNKQCVCANLDWWRCYTPRIHSLKNDERYPVSVWAMAEKPGEHTS